MKKFYVDYAATGNGGSKSGGKKGSQGGVERQRRNGLVSTPSRPSLTAPGARCDAEADSWYNKIYTNQTITITPRILEHHGLLYLCKRRLKG